MPANSLADFTVGKRVRIVSGTHEGKEGSIAEVTLNSQLIVDLDSGEKPSISIHNVVLLD